ncbi:MAG: hypothetical protein K2K06_00670 [Oscillospiraceae bacterium]|nr:hypothetical protein [Oscillospiraceae bacterium]
MKENTLKKVPDFIKLTDAIAKISKDFGLDEKDLIAMLGLIGCATQEQKDRAFATLLQLLQQN